jgi:hypothetical protein
MNRNAMMSTVAARAFASPSGTMNTTPEAVQAARRNHSATVNDVMLKRSPDSAAMLEYWDLTDALTDGIEAVRLGGEKFLPRFTDEDDIAYRQRLAQTKMTNVYNDGIDSLSAKPFEEEIELIVEDGKTLPEAIEGFQEDVDGSGNNLTVFASHTFRNGINSAVDWIFVDHPPIDAKVRNMADYKKAGIRPYWSHVLGRNILDPRSKVINGKETLTYIRIFEPGPVDHIRVFTRDDTGGVTWELFEKRNDWRDQGAGQTQFHSIETGRVTIGVIPLVPFVTGRRDGRGWKLFPAMRNAADLQIEMYLQESALKWNKMLGAYSMLAGNGVKPPLGPDGKPAKLLAGPGRVIYSPPDGNGNSGSWEWIQPSAEIMKFLAEDVKDTASQLRELIRQPLTAQSGNLTVITTAYAAGKAKSAVKAWAFGLKDALENAMVMTRDFMGIKKDEYDPVVSVYVEFDEFMDGKDLESLDADRDRLDISQETLWEEKKRRGVYSAEFTADREKKRLLAELPGDGTDRTPSDPDPDPPQGE